MKKVGKKRTNIRLTGIFLDILTFESYIVGYLYTCRHHMIFHFGQSFIYKHTEWLCINPGWWTEAIIKSQWALLHLNRRISGPERSYVSLKDGKRGNRVWACVCICVCVSERARERQREFGGSRKGWWWKGVLQKRGMKWSQIEKKKEKLRNLLREEQKQPWRKNLRKDKNATEEKSWQTTSE